MDYNDPRNGENETRKYNMISEFERTMRVMRYEHGIRQRYALRMVPVAIGFVVTAGLIVIGEGPWVPIGVGIWVLLTLYTMALSVWRGRQIRQMRRGIGCDDRGTTS